MYTGVGIKKKKNLKQGKMRTQPAKAPELGKSKKKV
jgi:hypothetical protein